VEAGKRPCNNPLWASDKSCYRKPRHIRKLGDESRPVHKMLEEKKREEKMKMYGCPACAGLKGVFKRKRPKRPNEQPEKRGENRRHKGKKRKTDRSLPCNGWLEGGPRKKARVRGKRRKRVV